MHRIRDVLLLLPEWLAIVTELCEDQHLLRWLSDQPEQRERGGCAQRTLLRS